MEAEIGVDTGAAVVSQQAVRQRDSVTLFASSCYQLGKATALKGHANSKLINGKVELLHCNTSRLYKLKDVQMLREENI